MLKLEYNYWTGRPNSIVTSLRRSLSQHINKNEYTKVGITCNPEKRMCVHKKDPEYDWDRMIVKYETTSKKNTVMLEKILVDEYFDYLANKIGGGGGPTGEGEKQYLYILVQEEKSSNVMKYIFGIIGIIIILNWLF